MSHPTSHPNPHAAFISSCNNSPTTIKSHYATHRTARAATQSTLLTSPTYPGVTPDPILRALLTTPAALDPRHCLVIWARPPPHIKTLIAECQRHLATAVPHMYFQPAGDLHMTVLEVVHSLSAEGLEEVQKGVGDGVAEEAVGVVYELAYPRGGGRGKRARLGCPMVTYDGSGVALSFLPVDGATEDVGAGRATRTETDEVFTYHHLRSTLYDLLQAQGVQVASRYAVPSAHLTIGRFVSLEDTSLDRQGEVEADGGYTNDPAKMRAFVDAVDECNARLSSEFGASEGEWTVGEGCGLVLRTGRLWYGGGETWKMGRGL